MDIDKLYLASFNFTKGKDGKITIQFDDANYRENDNPTDEQNFKDQDLGYQNWKPKNEKYRQAHIQNQLFGNFINLLKTCGSIDKDGNITYGTNMHMLKRSIDNDTDLLNGEDGVLKIVDEAYSDSSSSIEEPFAYGSLSTQVNIMNAFITGKFGIGPFALHNNSHILTQLYQLSFRDGTNILNYLDALSLHEYIDKDGNSILSYLSALINANVDVAKDPYIQRLNVNQYTYDLITLLTRTGLGRNSFFFINQPVIRDLAVTYQNALGLLTESPELSDRERAEKEESDFITGKNFGKLLNDLISNSLNKFRSEKERTDASFSNKTIYRALFGENGVIITNTKGQKINKSILEDVLTNEEVRTNPNKKLSIDNLKTDTYYLIKEGNNTYDLSPLEVQGFVYLAKREFNTYSEALSNLVQVTKIDTKKHGISEQEQSEYLEKYQNLKKNGYRIFDKHLTDLLEKSFINFKTITAIQLLSKLMNNMTISHTRTFKNMISTACSMMNNYKKEFKKAISDGIIAYLKQKCVNDYMRENNIDWTSMIVHGNVPTLAERYIKIMDKIKNDFTGSYQSFIMNGVVLNSILDNLQRVAYSEPYGYDHYDLLTLGNTNDDSQEIQNHFMDDWTQLYESSDEEIKQFAVDLAVYAFMTSADTRGFTKFFKYVPLTIREAIGYTDRLENIRYAFSVGYNDADVDGVLEEVIRNLWLNNNVIPTEELYKDVFDRDSASTVRVDVVVGPRLTYKDIKKNKGETELYDRTDTFQLFAGITSFENGARLSIKQGSDGTYRRFIKIRRPGSRITDADPYLLYEFVGVGYNDIKGKNGNIIQSEYPMYAITYPKGFTVRVGNQVYSLYEYGRNDHYKHIINEDDFLRPDYQGLIEYNMQKLTELKQMFPNDVLQMSNNDDVWKLLEKVESLFGTQDYHDGVIAGNYFQLDNPVRNRLELRMARDMYRIQEADSDIFGPVTSNYNRSQVEKDIETLHIFTDNTDRSSGSNLISENNPYSWYLIKYGSDKPLMYPTKTQAVIRGLDNAYPISTQRHFNLDVEEGRWNDEDIEEFKQVIDDEIEEIRAAWDSGRYKRVRFGLGDGFFNSNISNISKERTPEIYKYLMRQLSDLESYITGEAPTKFKPDFEDDYEFMNEPRVLPTRGNTVQSGQQATINIYAGTGENADLSNFAERPFTIQNQSFKSVEQAFQTAKFQMLRTQLNLFGSASAIAAAKKADSLLEKLQHVKDGAEAKSIGNTRIKSISKKVQNIIDDFFAEYGRWNKVNANGMKLLIKASFEQNPQALQRLLDTGNAILTHTQGDGKWATEFPRILMEVRDELRQQNDNSDNYNSNEYGDGEEINHCK